MMSVVRRVSRDGWISSMRVLMMSLASSGGTLVNIVRVLFLFLSLTLESKVNKRENDT